MSDEWSYEEWFVGIFCGVVFSFLWYMGASSGPSSHVTRGADCEDAYTRSAMLACYEREADKWCNNTAAWSAAKRSFGWCDDE